MLKKPKVAIFSDLHLGIYGNSPDWHNIAHKWADWIVKDLKKKKIKDILFLGDFFHNRSEISVQTVHVASEIIDKFRDFNMLMIVGNHDAYYKNRADVHSLGLLKGHSNLTIIDKKLEFECFGKTFAFIPWNAPVECSVDYLFGHFEILSFKMNNFKVCDHGLSPVDLVINNKMIFSGHFHNRHSKKYNEGEIHYVGNTFPMDFSDVGNDRGYHILDVEISQLEFFKNPVSPEFKNIYLSRLDSVKEKDIQGNIIKLIIDTEMDDDNIEKSKNHLASFSPHQLTTEFNVTSKSIDNVETIESIDLGDMFEEFQKQLNLDSEKDERVKKIILELYDRNK